MREETLMYVKGQQKASMLVRFAIITVEWTRVAGSVCTAAAPLQIDERQRRLGATPAGSAQLTPSLLSA